MCLPWKHKWEILAVNPVFKHAGDKLPIYRIYILQCKNCGDIKRRYSVSWFRR